MSNPEYHAFRQEVDRILGCPYPTQLKGLHNVVQRLTSEDVCHWADVRFCLVDGLCAVLLDGLDRWPYVLEIITTLCRSTKIRDAVCKLRPRLLHDLVSRALEHDDVHSRYAAAVEAMLSSPLANEIPLPASIQDLFMRAFDRAGGNPSLANIRAAYSILQSTGTLLVSLLNVETLARLEDHFYCAMRKSKGAEDQGLSMYCLAMMQTVLKSRQECAILEKSPSTTQDSQATVPWSGNDWDPLNMQQFFTGSKVSKTLQLIVLRSLWAVRPSSDASFATNLECLSIANQIALGIERPVRRQWVSQNSIIVNRLCDKVAVDNIDRSLQVEALIFVATLLNELELPDKTIKCAKSIIADLRDYQHPRIEALVKSYSAYLDESEVQELMTALFEQALDTNDEQLVPISQGTMRLVQILTDRAKMSPAIASGCLQFLAAPSGKESIHALFKRLGVKTTVCQLRSPTSTCARATQRARHALVLKLTRLLLYAIAGRADGIAFESQIMSNLLNLHDLAAQRPQACQHQDHAIRGMSPHTHQVFAEIESTPDVRFPEWRQAVDEHIQLRAREDARELYSLFERACHGLENRCSEVEKPLQHERNRFQELKLQNDELNHAYQVLEARGIESHIRYQALEAEKEASDQALAATIRERDEFSRKVETVAQNLERVNAEAKRQIQCLERQRDHAELQHAAVYAQLQERQDELELELRNTIYSREQGLKEASTAQSDLSVAEKRICDVEQELINSKTLCAQQQADLESSEEARHRMAEAKGQIEAEMQVLKAHMDSVVFEKDGEMDKLRSDSVSNLRAAETSHQSEIEKLEIHHDEEVQRLNERIGELEVESKDGLQQMAAEAARRDEQLEEYKKRIVSLKLKCDQRDAQLAQAKAMRSTLMAALDVGNMQVESQMSDGPQRPPRTSSDDQENDSQPAFEQVRQKRVADVRPDGQHYIPPAVSSSAQSMGPTPKRTRPRRSFQGKAPPPTIAPERSSRASTAPRSLDLASVHASRVNRQPLGMLNSNTSPSKLGSDHAKKPSEVASTRPILGGSFDGSDLFTDTQERQLLDLEMLPEGNSETEL